MKHYFIETISYDVIKTIDIDSYYRKKFDYYLFII